MSPNKIVIAGGGTAGWLSAALLTKQWSHTACEICLVESPHIATVGVGEGSTPALKLAFEKLGIEEAEWMTHCNATYKLGIRFKDWSTQPGFESYFHPFVAEEDAQAEADFFYATQARRQGINVSASPDPYFFMTHLANKGLSPLSAGANKKHIDYSYHFDAGLLGQWLKNRCIKQGVKHVSATITGVQTRADGAIDYLALDTGQQLKADIFFDCSGFKSMLMERSLNVPFERFKEPLINDAAVTIATPITEAIPCETESSALKYGWAWRIPLQNRFGNGYVYSSSHTSAEHAELEFRQHLGLSNDTTIQARHLKMKIGRLKKNWCHNCVAVGLSQGFIEPLEATAIQFIISTVDDFIQAFEAGGNEQHIRDIHNQRIRANFEHIKDYIYLHYLTNTRNDSPYWQDVRDASAMSPSIKHIWSQWIQGADIGEELKRQKIDGYYTPLSWYCMLAGTGIFPPSAQHNPLTNKIKNYLADLQSTYNTKATVFIPHAQSLK